MKINAKTHILNSLNTKKKINGKNERKSNKVTSQEENVGPNKHV
jgi:hypothetical protein